MRAVVLEKPTEAKDICLSEIPIPQVKPGWVLVRIKAFGLNHSEQILRQFEINATYIQKPIIPGIECVGEIADVSDSTFAIGQKVIAMMGGMGRSFNGSYAEYAMLPIHHVFAVDSDLSWGELAAIPETYFTAWGSLFECLNLNSKDTLLIRGATCALGYAAIQLAKTLGCKVVATTHRKEKLPLLNSADEAFLDTGELTETVQGITRVLELVGPKTLRDSFRCVEKGGIVCHTGVLGGEYVLNGFDPIKEIPNGVYLTGFFSNYPTQDTVNNIFSFLNKHRIRPCVGRSYDFSRIADACSDMDSGKVNGKIVVKVGD